MLFLVYIRCPGVVAYIQEMSWCCCLYTGYVLLLLLVYIRCPGVVAFIQNMSLSCGLYTRDACIKDMS